MPATTEAPTLQYIYRCPKCHTTIRRDYDTANFFVFIVPPSCPKCHREMKGNQTQIKYNPAHKCNHACYAAIGDICECNCGGRNHGAYWIESEATKHSTLVL